MAISSYIQVRTKINQLVKHQIQIIIPNRLGISQQRRICLSMYMSKQDLMDPRGAGLDLQVPSLFCPVHHQQNVMGYM